MCPGARSKRPWAHSCMQDVRSVAPSDPFTGSHRIQEMHTGPYRSERGGSCQTCLCLDLSSIASSTSRLAQLNPGRLCITQGSLWQQRAELTAGRHQAHCGKRRAEARASTGQRIPRASARAHMLTAPARLVDTAHTRRTSAMTAHLLARAIKKAAASAGAVCIRFGSLEVWRVPA